MKNTKNALAELAERLKNGIYNNPNDARFDKPVVCASLDANDVLKALRIIEEFAKVETLFERMNAKSSEGNIVAFEELAHEFHLAKEQLLANCRAIAEEGGAK